ncbi:aerotaxis receptor [Herbaspirillum sp. Sphag1AN]|uniref:methyl-accepting chemotaxis protein n=1 Tax=unclassified Herbaspirillum TaxID=2624150 RepID=UPI00161CF3F0|nr:MULTISPECIES: methyl-accepting chemotaxis protein [unclassified Herbaspirillum]MBB3214268.1 aerotaxis receptor [Herbaspirillum sp. Sphag1AN]MBB3247320.1 aerotaxis receptor [Herbaspirillum sp. Sphag64]
MRTNLPVTNMEQPLRDGESIVSKTDLQGNIVYVNPYFIEISGFEEAELIGAPQNIVRHPDMPAEAFADMWSTLKSGIPWNGIVKNRCKNGNFYWVMANVTPVRENGKQVGYMSVRTRPTREQTAAADAAYRLFRQGKAKGLAIHQGEVVSTSIVARIAALTHMSLAVRIGLMMGFIMLLLTGFGIASMQDQSGGGSSAHVLGWVALLSVLVVGYFWYALHQAIMQPLKLATAVARAIAGGDLTSKFASTRKDDTGQLLRALQQMTLNLIAIIGDVRANVDSIKVSTQEIARGNMDLSGRTEAQASSLQQTAASMEQLASNVRQNAEHASEANKSASSASEVAIAGGEVVNKVTTTMGEISESARRIVDIIGIIDSIAFQTNILALNAAVEAARAGEQGRGFAVVATEVRNLAHRSSSAAKEIKSLIDVSVEKVDTGVQLVAQAGTTMEGVVSSVQRVTNIISEISIASGEQNTGIQQVNQAVTSMDEVTQQNAALVEQAAAAAASLEEQSVRLAQAVSVFKLSGEAGGLATAPARNTPSAATAPSSISNSSATRLKIK